MSNDAGNKRFVSRLIAENLESFDSSNDSIQEFIKADGIPIDDIVHEGLRRIKQHQLQISARKTEEEAAMLDLQRERAEAMADELINAPGFSLSEYIKQTPDVAVLYKNFDLNNFDSANMRDFIVNLILLQGFDSENDDPK